MAPFQPNSATAGVLMTMHPREHSRCGTGNYALSQCGTMLCFTKVFVAHDGTSCPRKRSLHASPKGASLSASRRITDADRCCESIRKPSIGVGLGEASRKI
jgi:hypothetical protein